MVIFLELLYNVYFRLRNLHLLFAELTANHAKVLVVQFTLTFPAESGFSVTNITTTARGTVYDTMLINQTTTNGMIQYEVYLYNRNATALTVGSGEIARIGYTTDSRLTKTNLQLTNVVLADNNAAALGITTINGSIEYKAETGVDNPSLEKSITVYPNPASNVIKVDFESIGDYSITIFDMKGKQVLTSKNQKTFDVSGFANGVYMLKVITNEGVAVKKFVKE